MSAPRNKPNWVDVLGVAFIGAGFFAAAFAAWVASDTQKKGQRAYVVVKETEPIQTLAVGERVHIFSRFENLGQTPVYEARWRSGLDILPYPTVVKNMSPGCDVIMQSPDETRAYFGKEQSFDKLRDAPLTQPEIDAVMAGRSAIYFIGRVCYSDIFKYSHHTDFCLRWRWTDNAVVGEFCETGNEGDRD
jgi:hypothetical protein